MLFDCNQFFMRNFEQPHSAMNQNFALQMLMTQDGPPAVCLSSSSIGDALKQHMLLHLDLKHVLQLAATCTAWHQLITAASVHDLSKPACQSLLPHGVTSELPLLELIKQQAQLLLQLRGKQASSASTKHLSFDEDFVGGSPNRWASLRLLQLHWSPCARVEDPSRWLLVEPYMLSPGPCTPIVFNTQTGQRIRFRDQASGSQLPRPSLGHSDRTCAAWMNNNDRVLFFQPGCDRLFSYSVPADVNMHLADVHGQSIRQLSLLELSGFGKHKILLIAACDVEGHVRDILFSAARVTSTRVSRCRKDQITVYDVCSQQLLYQLRCPGGMTNRTLQGCRQHRSLNQLASQEEDGEGWDLTVARLCLSPNKELLLAVWIISLHKECSRYGSYSHAPRKHYGPQHSFIGKRSLSAQPGADRW